MGKKRLYGYILLVLVFLIYVAAVMPFPRTVIFWIVFAFSLFAIILQIYTIHSLRKEQACTRDKFYDFPLLRVSVLYLIIQFGASLLLMFFSGKVPIFAAVLVEVILLAAAIAGIFAVQTARGEVIRQDMQLKRELVKMQELQERIDRLIVQCDEGQIKEMLQKLGEEVRYSNPVSGDISEEIEEEITVAFSEIEELSLAGDWENATELCSRMGGLLKERERLCRRKS